MRELDADREVEGNEENGEEDVVICELERVWPNSANDLDTRQDQSNARFVALAMARAALSFATVSSASLLRRLLWRP